MTSHGDLPVPEHGLLLTHFLTVRDVRVSRRFYADIFGGEVVMEENPAIVKIANSWIIMNPGGRPHPRQVHGKQDHFSASHCVQIVSRSGRVYIASARSPSAATCMSVAVRPVTRHRDIR